MILHITFASGANGVAYSGDIEKLMKIYNKWRRNKDARFDFFSDRGLHCLKCAGGGWCVGRWFDGSHVSSHFENLRPALKAL